MTFTPGSDEGRTDTFEAQTAPPDRSIDKKVKEVNIDSPEFDPKEIKDKMLDIMLNNGGIGLSANQVGLDAQVFIMGTSKEDATMCINPVVLQHTEDTTLETEGCLSFPNYFVKVRRPKEILATWYDENLEQKKNSFLIFHFNKFFKPKISFFFELLNRN